MIVNLSDDRGNVCSSHQVILSASVNVGRLKGGIWSSGPMQMRTQFPRKTDPRLRELSSDRPSGTRNEAAPACSQFPNRTAHRAIGNRATSSESKSHPGVINSAAHF